MTTAIAAPRRSAPRASSASSAGNASRSARSLASAARYPQSRLLHIVAPSLKVPDAAAASVFSAVRTRGPIARDAIAQLTQLSIATVNRQVTALLEAGILRERADLAVSGAIGRPRVPVEVNHEPYLTLGIHIGARTTSIVATDLFGRTLDVVETPTPSGSQSAALATLASSARRYLSRWHRRRPLWVGVAAGGVVDSATGYLDHPRLGWADAPVGPVLAEALALPVSVASRMPPAPRPEPASTCMPVRRSATRCPSTVACTPRPAVRAPSRACPRSPNCSAVQDNWSPP
ncbi:ROK family protein [Mycolicibacterium neworleansense]|uniref:ROK family protein n=1 Tax=Mycolicibacterium neworleansense TaxID=146018 RepID=A0A0H5S5B2_9MYCO|nr:ROK family protein [Mycolicibacterium neworleansense]